MQDGVRHHLRTAVFVQHRVAVLVGDGVLQVEVTSQHQSLAFQQVLERHLAPVSLNLVAASHHIGQMGGSLVDFGRLFRHRLQLFRERCCLLGGFSIGVVDGLLQLLNVLSERGGECLYRLRILRFQPVCTLFQQPCGKVLKLLLPHFCLVRHLFAQSRLFCFVLFVQQRLLPFRLFLFGLE